MCTIHGIVILGILLAVLDVIHSLITSAFYCYQLVMDIFYLCPLNMDVTLCHNKIYVYEQLGFVTVILQSKLKKG
ncbi:hypothetical protein E2C01_066174 [Portunus trituberculatus]|uniref:Uncharacterized protein n=1 Tax=Portunus trituberculatus TaxID=210409 RepID=A0A5B7HTT6_PORTR|nr:hypothetical protein [Portunus trituberculatus]